MTVVNFRHCFRLTAAARYTATKRTITVRPWKTKKNKIKITTINNHQTQGNLNQIEMDLVAVNLDLTKLSTNRDVMQYLMFLRDQAGASSGAFIGFNTLYQPALTTIRGVWTRALIPMVSLTTSRTRIIALVEEYRSLVKAMKTTETIDKWNHLFYLAKCDCSFEVTKRCGCSEENRIPNGSKDFYIDQWNARYLTVENCTVPNPNAIAVAVAIAGAGAADFYDEYDFQDLIGFGGDDGNGASTSAGYAPSSSAEEDYQQEVGNDSSEDEIDDEALLRIKVGDLKLNTFCDALDRAKVSDRFAALLATCLFKDVNISCIIDRNKIRGARKLARIDAKRAFKCHDLLKGIFFDGKKNQTLVRTVVEGLNAPRNEYKLEEHIIMVKEPESKLIGFVTVPNGTGESIMEGMVNYLTEENFSLDHLVAVGCDGTPSNTGKRIGAVALLERRLKRPLQWLVCLFHFNELPLRELYKKTVGPTRNPETFYGPIATEASIAHTIPVKSNKYLLADAVSYSLRYFNNYFYSNFKCVGGRQFRPNTA